MAAASSAATDPSWMGANASLRARGDGTVSSKPQTAGQLLVGQAGDSAGRVIPPSGVAYSAPPS
jgi:hypothetical protein